MKPKIRVVLALLLAMSMWCYADLILVPFQVADAARTGRPRGNLSDLYPRWLGTRELLLHRRDPYSSQITREIQVGYYGRALDPTRPNDPKDQQGFAYPIYVVFLLAPSIWLPFSTVQILFRALLFALSAGSVLLWLKAVQWRLSVIDKLTAITLVVGSFPAVQAIKLQQLSGLVCFLLAACVALIVTERFVLAGVVLAVGTIKPQLALPFAGWLAVWVLGDWRSRRNVLGSFLATFGLLVIGGEILLPGWIGRFRGATAAYLQYAPRGSVLDLVLTPAWGRVAAVVLIIAVAYVNWSWRRAPAGSDLFRWNLGLVLAAILVVIPTSAPYNQLLLTPSLLLLAEAAPRFWNSAAFARLCLVLVAVVLFLPWLLAVGLDLSLLVHRQTIVGEAWAQVPVWMSWSMPFPVLAAAALGAAQIARGRTFARRRYGSEILL